MAKHATIEDLRDWNYAGQDSTGRCREENPLKEWCPEDWLTIEQIDYTHNWMDRLEKDDGMAPLAYAAINEDQVVAIGPPIFGLVYTIFLITRHAWSEGRESFEIEGFTASL